MKKTGVGVKVAARTKRSATFVVTRKVSTSEKSSLSGKENRFVVERKHLIVHEK